jgi:hypothetical protein
LTPTVQKAVVFLSGQPRSNATTRQDLSPN